VYRRTDVPSTAKTRDSCRSLIPIAAATCPALGPVRSGGPRHKSMRQLGALSLDPRRGVLPGPRSGQARFPPRLYRALLMGAGVGRFSESGPRVTDFRENMGSRIVSPRKFNRLLDGAAGTCPRRAGVTLRGGSRMSTRVPHRFPAASRSPQSPSAPGRPSTRGGP
jgi:hypothetical protein